MTVITEPSATPRNGKLIESAVTEEFTKPLDPTAVPEQRGAPAKPKSGEPKPIVAPWLKDRDAFSGKVRDTGKRAAHSTAWHVLHSPLHALRILRYVPRGLWRVVAALWNWTWHTECKPLRREAVDANAASDYLRLKKEWKEGVHRRWIGLAVVSALVLITLVLLWFLLPSWTIVPWLVITPGWDFSLSGVAALVALGYHGRPIDAPLIKRATAVSGNPPLRSETVVNALVSLRIPGMTKPEDIRLVHDIASPSSGYSFELELPPGVTAEAVMEKRSELSAALRHPLGTVWPSVGKRHQGHLVLFVSHEDMNTIRQKPWPLLKSGTVDVFAPQPMFTDQRNRWIDLTLAYTSGVIGAVPRMGKSFALRELLLVAALDPTVKIYAFDFKGTGDLSPLRLVAHRYACTARPEKIAELLPIFEELQAELYRRAEVIEGLSYEECPENKVTRALASRRSLGLEPIFVGIDECHEIFDHEEAAVKARYIKLVTDLVKRGPALGIMVYLATQKPSAASIPTAIAHNAIIRICLKVLDWQSNDQVLGSGMSKAGLKAQMFSWEDKGIAYLKGEGADAQIVRSVFGLDAPNADRVAKRARAARDAAGRLTGDAAGQAMETEAAEVALLDYVGQVLANAEAMHLTELAKGMADRWPGAWGSLDANGLGKLLRGLTPSIVPTTVWSNGKPGKGIKRSQLDISTTSQVAGEDPATGGSTN